MNTAHCILKSFEPLIDNQVQFLIVGTMPGEKSLSEGEYYAHPRNAMWPIISKLFNQGKAFTSYSQQKVCLLANHIGMWDNLQYCQRCGSLDSDISNEVPNDFETLCKQYPSIKRFLFNVKILGLKNVIINLGGNIVMFMPLGYFLPRIAKYKKGIVYTTFECFEFSFLVEIFQLYTKKGCCDVDDIILNTLGGFLGYIVYYICLREKIKKCQEREDVIDLNLQKKNNQKKG